MIGLLDAGGGSYDTFADGSVLFVVAGDILVAAVSD